MLTETSPLVNKATGSWSTEKKQGSAKDADPRNHAYNEPAKNITLIKTNILLSTYNMPGMVLSAFSFVYAVALLHCFHLILTKHCEAGMIAILIFQRGKDWDWERSGNVMGSHSQGQSWDLNQG